MILSWIAINKWTCKTKQILQDKEIKYTRRAGIPHTGIKYAAYMLVVDLIRYQIIFTCNTEILVILINWESILFLNILNEITKLVKYWLYIRSICNENLKLQKYWIRYSQSTASINQDIAKMQPILANIYPRYSPYRTG